MSRVFFTPSIRMLTAGPGDLPPAAAAADLPPATAAPEVTAARAAAPMSAMRVLRYIGPPLSTRACWLWSGAGLLADGPTGRRLPGDLTSPVAVCGARRPRSQWRVRAGSSPASHHLDLEQGDRSAPSRRP